MTPKEVEDTLCRYIDYVQGTSYRCAEQRGASERILQDYEEKAEEARKLLLRKICAMLGVEND